MTIRELIPDLKSGAKISSPTHPSTQNGEFIAKRDFLKPNGRTGNKLFIISEEGGEEVLSRMSGNNVSDYGDWTVV